MKKLMIVAMMCCLMLGGCGSQGVPQKEYDEVIEERDDLRKRLESLQEDYDEILQDYAELKTEIATSEIKKESGLENQIESDSREEIGDDTSDSFEKNNGEIEILAEYTLPDGIGWYTRHFMVIKNNTANVVDISTSSLAYDADGKMVGAADSDFYALGAGCVSLIYEAFETDQKIDHYEMNIKTSKAKYYDSVIQDLSYVQNDVDKGAIFQVTNNGDDAVEFVEGYTLFFLNGELVSYDSTYFTDDDSELKPGDTISKQITSYEEFDSLEFYLTGRK